MTFEQIQYFIEIVKAGSMSKAASNLIVSQPHMSMIIKSLENEIGYKLLHRTSKGVELTQQGAEFLYYAESISSNLSQIKNIKELPVQKKTDFTVTTHYISYAVLPFIKMLDQFSDQVLNFKIRQNSFFEVLEDIEQGISELGLLSISNDQRMLIYKLIEKRGLEIVNIGQLEMKMALANGHPLYDSDTISISQIKQYPLVFFDITDKDFISTQALKRLEIHTFPRRITIQDFFYLYHLMSTSQAVTFLGVHHSTDIRDIYKRYGFDIKFFPLENPVFVDLVYVKRVSEPLSDIGQYYVNELFKIANSNI